MTGSVSMFALQHRGVSPVRQAESANRCASPMFGAAVRQPSPVRPALRAASPMCFVQRQQQPSPVREWIDPRSLGSQVRTTVSPVRVRMASPVRTYQASEAATVTPFLAAGSPLRERPRPAKQGQPPPVINRSRDAAAAASAAMARQRVRLQQAPHFLRESTDETERAEPLTARTTPCVSPRRA